MFYLSYIRSELVRRKARTILTLLGLAIGVALVIVISSLSRGVDHAQKQALDPLSSIGTDLTVTLAPQTDTGGGPFGGGGRDVIQANSSVLTDLSRLGKPGAKFDHTFLLPGTQLTFPQSQTKQIAAIDGVSAVSSGLVLSAVHQSGTVPKIVAKLKTGGQRLTVTGRVRFNFSQAEQDKIRACFQKVFQSQGVTPGTAPGRGGGGRLGGGAGGAGFLDSPAERKCLPAQVRNFRRTITTPQQLVQQVVGLVKPPLGGQTADVHVPLAKLQALADQKSLTNVVLVRPDSGTSVGQVQKAIEARFPNAQVASAKQVADQISGSLVAASNLSHRLGIALAALAALSAFLLAALLTLSSVGKRVRELGTLKALGWTQGQVVRQVVGESLAQGVAGGVLGVVVGVDRRRWRLRPRRSQCTHGDRSRGADCADRRHGAARRAGARARGWFDCRWGRRTPRSATPARGRPADCRVMYEVRTVSKWFVKGPTIVRAVDAVSLEIEAGEFVALEGPSGSGKTTLLQLLGALDRPSEGAVDFEGRDLATLRDNELARLRLGAFGFVFQQFNLIPTPSAVQNVESALAPAGVHGVELRERSEALLAEVGLADEPTGNLDSATGDDVIDLLAGLAATHGATVVVATHDADRAARATKRLAMRDGKILSPVSAGA